MLFNTELKHFFYKCRRKNKNNLVTTLMIFNSLLEIN